MKVVICIAELLIIVFLILYWVFRERGLSNVTLFKLFHDCGTYCEWCKETFAVYDNPNHIGRIRNIEKQKSFLKSRKYFL